MIADLFSHGPCTVEIDSRTVQVAGAVESSANVSQDGAHPRGIAQSHAAAQALAPQLERRVDSRAAERIVAREAEAIRRDRLPTFGRRPRLEPGDAAHEERITPGNAIRPGQAPGARQRLGRLGVGNGLAEETSQRVADIIRSVVYPRDEEAVRTGQCQGSQVIGRLGALGHAH